MFFARRELEGVEVGVGDADVLGLPAAIRTHSYVSVGACKRGWVSAKDKRMVEKTKELSWLGGLTSCKSRVDSCAECSFAFFAVTATAVGDVEGHDDPVALFQECHATPKFFDYAHVLMAFEESRTSQQIVNEVKHMPAQKSSSMYTTVV